MKVKAKWAVKVDGKWQKAGDEFEVESTDGFAEAVEVLHEEPGKLTADADKINLKEAEPVQEAEAEPKPRAAARTRRKVTEK